MSSRWYPRFVKGNPQLRIFLPDFWMKLVKPKDGQLPDSKVLFRVDPRMSDFDVRNYLEKIYDVRVAHVKSVIKAEYGLAKGANYIIKKDEYREVYVSLPQGTTFKYPNLFPQDKIDKQYEEEKEMMEDVKKMANESKRNNWERADVPQWFS